MCEVVIAIFIKQSLSVPSSICYGLGIIEGKGKELEAEELSQPDKNHQKGKEVILFGFPQKREWLNYMETVCFQ